MSVIQETRFSASAEDFAMALHDMSMSKDQKTAAAGRLLKELNGVIATWFEAEMDRGTEFSDVAQSYPVIIANAAAMMISHVCSYDAGKQAILMRALAGPVAGALKELSDQMNLAAKKKKSEAA